MIDGLPHGFTQETASYKGPIRAGWLPPTADCFSTANEVHNFYPIIFPQHGGGPVSATYYVLIEFDCYSLGREVELCD